MAQRLHKKTPIYKPYQTHPESMKNGRTKIVFLLITIVVLSYGCEQKVATDQPLIHTVSVTWTGVIPCADCPGIKYELTLKNDGTFREESVYLEEDVQPFIDTGQWKIDKDSIITLGKRTVGKRYFKYTGVSLKMLDNKKQPIESSLAEYYVLERKEKIGNSHLGN